MILKITDVAEFNKETAEGRVLVDFYADWCGPCKMLKPSVEKLAEEHPEIKVIEVNVDEAGELAARYRINSIPSLIYFEGGKPVDQSIGFIPEPRLKAFVKVN
ncbi:MAG: thioredoxin [Bacilli bacterium]|nr:thioredoxin [Bacilli bacterium]